MNTFYWSVTTTLVYALACPTNQNPCFSHHQADRISLTKMRSTFHTNTRMAAASAAPFFINGAMKMCIMSQPRLSFEGSTVKETKALVSKLCHSILKPRQLIPSGVQKRMHMLPWLHNCDPVFFKRVVGAAKSQTSSNDIESTRSCIVLDIEGTTTPISFVTDVLFPYARDNLRKHLELTYHTAKTQHDIDLLRAQVQEDLENNVVEAVPIPSDGDREEVIAALVANVKAMIKADRKITSLKQLQGNIWQTGFQNDEIETVVYDDVPEALEKWHALGLKVYIYSSGSRLAQRLLFGNTNYGDLRKYLCGYFDTTIGNKKETKSYIEIAETLGVDHPSQILFVTDVYQEATAAKAAGLEVMISVRPGNGPLPENHGFHTITSFSEI